MLQTYVRLFAGASLGVLMLGLAVFNVLQWLSEGFVILAIVALCAELIGFVMAVMVEIAARARRWLAMAVCGLILAVCAGYNIIGAERAWDASMARHLDGARREAQQALDLQRSELGQKLARARSVISSYDHLLPTADTYRARQAGMREAWEMATAQARDDALAAQRDLDRLPIVAEVGSPFQTWQVQLGFGLAELIKASGLWAIGLGTLVFGVGAAETLVFTPEAPRFRKRPQKTGETVLRFPTDDGLRETVIRLRAEGVSYGQIQKTTGVLKGTAYKWVNAKHRESVQA